MHEGWLGEIEGIDLTLTFLRQKREQAPATPAHHRHPRAAIQTWRSRGREAVMASQLAKCREFGKGGDIATNRRDEQELSVLCLRVLQAALVYVNTLMVQDVLAGDGWAGSMPAEDRRGLTPLFWTHVAPYGSLAGSIVLLGSAWRRSASGAANDRPV
jgi:hypothetical protein